MKRLSRTLIDESPTKLKIMENSLKIPIQGISNDLLYNILHFLDRKEIENKRLISIQWNRTILVNDAVLPLLILGKISYSPAYGRVCWNILPDRAPNSLQDNPGPVYFILESLNAHFLKSHIYREIEFYLNDKEVMLLRKILKRKDRRLRVIVANFVLEGELSQEMFEEDIKRINTILTEIVSFKTIGLHFIGCSLEKALKNFRNSNIKIKIPYDYINLDTSLASKDSNNHNFLLETIKTIGNNVQLSMNYQYLTENLGENFITIFMEHTKIEKMIRKMIFKNRNKNDVFFDDFMTKTCIFLEKKKAEIIILHNEEQYILKRKDGWALKFSYPRNRFITWNEVEIMFSIEKPVQS